MRHPLVVLALAVSLRFVPALAQQSSPASSSSLSSSSSERLQVSPPIRRAAPPPAAATAEDLEQRGDQLRAEKFFVDALDYYRAAIKKNPNSSMYYIKAGIAELQMKRLDEGSKDFERAIKLDPRNAVAHNNLGVVYYEEHKYAKAIKQYEKALQLRPEEASYYSNAGAAYFSKKEFEKAVEAYNHAVQLDPDILDRTARNGVQAQMSSPEDRAHYDYVMAKLYAKLGVTDKSLTFLRRAIEDGYKKIDDVYKDAEFATLRKDPRFTALMNAKPVAIPE